MADLSVGEARFRHKKKARPARRIATEVTAGDDCSLPEFACGELAAANGAVNRVAAQAGPSADFIDRICEPALAVGADVRGSGAPWKRSRTPCIASGPPGAGPPTRTSTPCVRTRFAVVGVEALPPPHPDRRSATSTAAAGDQFMTIGP